MSISLMETLEAARRAPGKTHRVDLEDGWAEIRFVPRHGKNGEEESMIPESDIMLDAWTELPRPKPVGSCISHLGKSKKPVIPIIPPDEEDE